MTPRKRQTSPEQARKIAAHAREHIQCQDCSAPPGEPCIDTGSGTLVHKVRYVAAAIALKRADKPAERNPEQGAVLAVLPRIPREEIEACRTERGGYRFTRAWFLAHGLPYPPVAGWRQAVEREAE
jgi:hypothetical protein